MLSLFKTRDTWSYFGTWITKRTHELTGTPCPASHNRSPSPEAYPKFFPWVATGANSSHLTLPRWHLYNEVSKWRIFPQEVQKKELSERWWVSFSWCRSKKLNQYEIQSRGLECPPSPKPHLQRNSPLQSPRRRTGIDFNKCSLPGGC